MEKFETIKQGSISELQTYIGAKIKQRGFDDETLHERLILLMEEVGELAKACRKVSGMHVNTNSSNNQQTVGQEICDVINMVFAIGIELGIDIEKEFLAKEEKNDQRIYKKADQQK